MLPYAGGELLFGQAMAMMVLLDSLIVGWVLFLPVKAINRPQRLASRGLDQLRGVTPSEEET